MLPQQFMSEMQHRSFAAPVAHYGTANEKPPRISLTLSPAMMAPRTAASMASLSLIPDDAYQS
jgi:hypothetical protein